MYLSVVAPCMNEEDGLEEFYLRLVSTFRYSQIKDYEVILVDDGSRDRTWDLICYLTKRDYRVRGIRLSRNFGHQAALSAGLHQAAGERIFIIDSDLQDPPELLAPMLEKMDEGHDVVYGKRTRRHGETKFKLLSASLFYRILSLFSDIAIPIDTGDFRLINRKVLEAFNSINESQRFTRGLISWLGFKQAPVMYDRHPRFAGSTKYPLRKMINFSLDAITGFSLKPLRLITYLGITAAFMSIGAFIYSVNEWWHSNTVTGWTSIMTAICVLSSAQLICIGVVGEYVGRTFTESKRRPLYVIQDRSEELPPGLQIHLLNTQKNGQSDEQTIH